jgi:hypothetical protein
MSDSTVYRPTNPGALKNKKNKQQKKQNKPRLGVYFSGEVLV